MNKLVFQRGIFEVCDHCFVESGEGQAAQAQQACPLLGTSLPLLLYLEVSPSFAAPPGV